MCRAGTSSSESQSDVDISGDSSFFRRGDVPGGNKMWVRDGLARGTQLVLARCRPLKGPQVGGKHVRLTISESFEPHSNAFQGVDGFNGAVDLDQVADASVAIEKRDSDEHSIVKQVAPLEFGWAVWSFVMIHWWLRLGPDLARRSNGLKLFRNLN